MPHTSSDTIERAEAMFKEGKLSIRVSEQLRISVKDAMAIKHAWLAKNAPPAKPKPEAKAAAPKAKKAKADASDK